jgi:hypothetical protein
MDHNTMLAFLMGQRRGGGSGETTLPTLTNPAGAEHIVEGYEAVDGDGKVVTGAIIKLSGGRTISATDPHNNGTYVNAAGYLSTTTDYFVEKNTRLTCSIPASSFGDATPEDVAVGKTFTSANGVKLAGTHVCESADSGDSNWAPFDKSGEHYIGEVFNNGDGFISATNPSLYVTSPTNQYRVTVDGASQVVTSTNLPEISFAGGYVEHGFMDTIDVYFDDQGSHTFKLESWIGEEPYVEGGSSGGGSGSGGFTPCDTLIDHSGIGSNQAWSFSLGSDVTIPAGGSLEDVPATNATHLSGGDGNGSYGYIVEMPWVQVRKGSSNKYPLVLRTLWNSSGTDATLKAGVTYRFNQLV